MGIPGETNSPGLINTQQRGHLRCVVHCQPAGFSAVAASSISMVIPVGSHPPAQSPWCGLCLSTMLGIRLPKLGLEVTFAIYTWIWFNLIKLKFYLIDLFEEPDAYETSFSWKYCGSRRLGYEPPVCVPMPFCKARSIWKTSLFFCFSRKTLPPFRPPLCYGLTTTWDHVQSSNTAQALHYLFQYLCTAAFSTDKTTCTAGPQVLTCPSGMTAHPWKDRPCYIKPKHTSR